MGSVYGELDFTADKNRWQWPMMIMQPDHINADMVAEASAELRRKKNLPALDKVRCNAFDERLSAQIMHIGPYSAEKANIDRLRAYIAERGCEPTGRHHEIYLGDPRRAAPEKLKTVLCQPMCPRD